MSEMTMEQAARAVAKEVLEGIASRNATGSITIEELPQQFVEKIVTLLAAQRAAVLEAGAELIDKRLTHYHTTKGVNAFTRAIQRNEAEGCAETIRKLAQEQRP